MCLYFVRIQYNSSMTSVSPFDQASSSVIALYLEPMLNSYYKSYQDILTVSNVPAGPLSR